MKLDRTTTKDEDKVTVLMNDLAYHYLVMACMDYAFGYVLVEETADPHGDACKAWVDLYKCMKTSQ